MSLNARSRCSWLLASLAAVSAIGSLTLLVQAWRVRRARMRFIERHTVLPPCNPAYLPKLQSWADQYLESHADDTKKRMRRGDVT